MIDRLPSGPGVGIADPGVSRRAVATDIGQSDARNLGGRPAGSCRRALSLEAGRADARTGARPTVVELSTYARKSILELAQFPL